ncbi:MAG: cytochrome c3 family protein [Deltaproteobacteria bacterium]|nr:cytochrome c3 family protein [Deltaproteobacteria bacterium]MBW2543338.1 cytochrome c3 family protein [Deltaproteobacteria bacterium]
MKNRAKLLGIVALLPWALASPAFANSGAVEEEEYSSEAAEETDELTAPELEPRPSSIMGDLIFPHVEHVEDMELECDECHHETNAVPLNSPHESYFDDLWVDCGSCHHESGASDLEPKSCYECHDSKLRDIADERLSSKVILHKNCWKCHEVETGLAASESCELCHSR